MKMLARMIFPFVMLLFVCHANTFAADNIDISIRAAITDYLQKHRINEGITAIQASILAPNQLQTRDYVVGHISREQQSNKATTNSIIQWGSITKAFTASVLLRLESQSENGILGKTFNLDQTIGYWLPEYFKNNTWPQSWEKIKINQLLNMTSGIPDILASKALRAKYSNDLHHNFSLNEVIQYVADLEKETGCSPSIHCFYPGTNYYYSNTGYLIAAKIAEKVSGDSFENLMNSFLSDVKLKSGAKDIFYYQTNLPTNIINRMINGYYEHLPDQIFNIPTGTNVTTSTLSVGAPAGGVVSSTHNMILAVHALLTGKLLPYSEMSKLNQFVCTNDDSNAEICIPGQEVVLDIPGIDVYGLGTSAENDSDLGKIWGYQGSFIGYRSLYLWVKSDDIIIGITANSAGSQNDDLSSLALQIYQIVKSAI